MLIGSLMIKYLIKKYKKPESKKDFNPIRDQRHLYLSHLKKTQSVFKVCIQRNDPNFKQLSQVSIESYTLSVTHLIELLNLGLRHIEKTEYLPARLTGDTSQYCEKPLDGFLSENNHILLLGPLSEALINLVTLVITHLEGDTPWSDYYYSRMSIYLIDLHTTIKLLNQCYTLPRKGG